MFDALDMNELVRKDIEIVFKTKLIIQEDMNYVYICYLFLGAEKQQSVCKVP